MKWPKRERVGELKVKKPKRWIVVSVSAVLLLVSVIGIVVLVGGGSKDAYAKTKISVGRQSVSLSMDIESNAGNVTYGAGSVLQTEVSVTVKKMPKTINNYVTAFCTSDGVVSVPERIQLDKKGRGSIPITALNGGSTQVKVMTAGGQKVAFIDVNVAIPAKDLAVQTNVFFGVVTPRNDSLSGMNFITFDERDFDFYATSDPLSQARYSATINNVEYSLPSGSLNGCYISGNRLYVPKTATAGMLTVRATLTATGQSKNFDVQIFPAYNGISIGETTVGVGSTKYDRFDSSIIFCDLVANPQQYSGLRDIREFEITDLGSSYGFFVESRDSTVAIAGPGYINGQRFNIVANGFGECWVDVVTYPIVNGISLNTYQYSHLWHTVSIWTEVRNVFPAGLPASPSTPALQIIKENGALVSATNPLNPSTDIRDRQFFQIIFDQEYFSNLYINETRNYPSNKNVVFELYVGINKLSGNIEDWLQITYRTGITENIVKQSMLTGADASGIPYDAFFSIAISPTASADNRNTLLNNNFTLRVSSFHGTDTASPSLSPYARASFAARAIQSITKIIVTNEAGAETNRLYPVKGGANNGAFNFFVSTNPVLSSAIIINNFGTPKFGENCYYNGNEMFQISAPTSASGNRIQYTVTIKPAYMDIVEIGCEYDVWLSYKTGITVHLIIEILQKFDNFDMSVHSVSSGTIYGTPQKTGTNIKLIDKLYVKIGGIYSLDLFPDNPNASIWYTLASSSSAGPLGPSLDFLIDPITNTFIPLKESASGTFTLTVYFHSLNPSVFPMGFPSSRIITVVVVNPLIAAGFSENQNYVTIYSYDSLGYDDRLDQQHITYVDIELTFANLSSTQASNSKAPVVAKALAFPSSVINVAKVVNTTAKFRIEGLKAYNDWIEIQFFLTQSAEGLPNAIDFTYAEPLKFYIKVLEAVKIGSIRATEIGSMLNISLDSRNGTKAVPVRPNTTPSVVYNPELYYAFEIKNPNTGNYELWNRNSLSYNGTAYQHVYDLRSYIDFDTSVGVENLRNGIVTAKTSNVGIYEYPITLVIFSADSMRYQYENGTSSLYRDPTNAASLSVTHLKLSVFIFDQNPSVNTNIISSKDDFLKAFYLSQNPVNVYQSKTGVNFGYYRLTADIDLGGIRLYPIRDFCGQLVGTNEYAMAGGTATANYSISNFTINPSSSVLQVYPTTDKTYNYGLFDVLTTQKIGSTTYVGTVEGITFRNVNINIVNPNLSRAYNTIANVGVVAGVNEGLIRDVIIEIGQFYYGVNRYEKLNIGAVAGLNKATIESSKGLKASGTLRVGMGPEDANTNLAYVYNINAGGIVGVNEVGGKMLGQETTGNAIEDTLSPNSEVSVLLLNGTDSSTPEISDKNVGGLAGKNKGEIKNLSTECVLYNSIRGRTGGLVGQNDFNTINSQAALIQNCQAGGIVYARGSVGGLVGRNEGDIERSFYDFFINKKVRDRFNSVVTTYNLGAAIDWANNPFYAGIIIGKNAGNASSEDTTDGQFNANKNSHTVVGGIAGVNAGNIRLSFAASSFGEPGTKEVLGLDYFGDIHIVGASNIVAGGIVGRTQDASRVRQSYANLAVYFNGAGVSPTSNRPTFGGMAGWLDSGKTGTSTPEFLACYAQISYVTDGGVGGSAGSLYGENNTGLGTGQFAQVFTFVYTVFNKTVQWERGLYTTEAAFISYTNANGGYFLPSNSASGYDYPLIKLNNTNPLYIGKPTAIAFGLKSADSLHETYAAAKNNRGGFNYVLPAETNRPATNPEVKNGTYTNSAALFFTSSGFASSSVIANRYYFKDLFDINIDPEFASRRMDFYLENNNGVADWGIDTSSGEPRYYLQLRRTGSFTLVAQSTRAVSAPIAGRILFDVVEGITNQELYTSVVRENGKRTFAPSPTPPAPDESWIRPAVDFMVQRRSPYFLRASVDNGNWDIAATYKPKDMPALSYKNGTTVENHTVETAYTFVPHITGESGADYFCAPLAISISVDFYGGASYLTGSSPHDLPQQVEIDGATSAAISGSFITDIVPAMNPTNYGAVNFNGVNADVLNALNLLELAEFSFSYDGQSFPLFTEKSLINIPRTVPDTDFGQGFQLVFTLSIESIDDLANSYKAYKYIIHISVIINESAYNNVDPNNIIPAIISGINGMVKIKEIETVRGLAKPLESITKIAVFGQDLHKAAVNHYSKTTKTNSGGLKVDENQHSSMNVFTDRDGSGGLLRVTASPYFANITSFQLGHAENGTFVPSNSSTKYSQYIDKDLNGNAIYKEWDIEFVQLVLNISDPENPVYESKNWGGIRQVSTVKRLGGVETYGWTGVYYFSTNIRVTSAPSIAPNMQLPAGTEFAVTIKIVSLGKTYTENIILGALDRPGVYFNYDEYGTNTQGIQAIGTKYEFGIYTFGETTIHYDEEGENIFEVSGPLAGYAKVGRGLGTDNFILEISAPTENWENLIGEKVYITVPFTTEEFGREIETSTTLEVQVVLFKVTGFSVSGVAGNTVRLLNSNRQSMYLVPNVLCYRDDGIPKLTEAIRQGVNKLQDEINIGSENVSSEWLVWTGANDTNGFVLNKNWNESSEYYQNEASSYLNWNGQSYGSHLNFALGKGNGQSSSPGHKFITSMSYEGRTNTLSVQMFLDYTKGKVEVKANSTSSVSSFFNITTIQRSDEDNPIMIYQDYRGQNTVSIETIRRNGFVRNQYYIVMENLVLNNWRPIPFDGASFDGNNKKITVNSFDIGVNSNTVYNGSYSTDIGLFSTVTSVVKNVNVVLPNFGALAQSSLDVDLTKYSQIAHTVNIGALAGTNKGVITNCAVLVDAQFDSKGSHDIANYNKTQYDKINGRARSRLAVFVGNKDMTVRLGSLVGVNEGVITNSRVMADVYLSGASGVNVKTAIVGGFVGQNGGTTTQSTGTIVSSFFRDANVTNDSNILGGTGSDSMTGGFVGENKANSVIRACYVMGVAAEIDQAAGKYGTVKYGEIKSRASSAGFVFGNSGIIEDCYANVRLERILSSPVSGFVYSTGNTSNITKCFVNNMNTLLTGYYAFVYYQGSNPSGTFLNNVFVLRGFNGTPGTGTMGFIGIDESVLEEGGAALSAFFDAYSMASEYEEEPCNVWQMTQFGPRLVGANEIAISIRKPDSILGPDGMPRVVDEPEYKYGSKINPIVITNGDQFNKYLYQGTAAFEQDEEKKRVPSYEIKYDRNVYQGYLRLANNINVKDDLTSFDKELQTHKLIFKGVFDGNGLRINGISANAPEDLDSAGLFSKLEYATIKNVTLDFVKYKNEPDSIVGRTKTTYVGGIAGIAINSNIVDVTQTSTNNASIGGSNIVGGVVGAVVNFNRDGENNWHRIENVRSNVRVFSNKGDEIASTDLALNTKNPVAEELLRYNYGRLGVAGGLIGILVNDPMHDEEMLLKEKDTYSKNDYEDQSKWGVSKIYAGEIRPLNESVIINSGNIVGSPISVSGDVVGGLIGFVGQNVVVEDINYNINGANTSSPLNGKFYVGGLVGINFGTIKQANITQTASATFTIGSNVSNTYIFSNIDKQNTKYGMVVGAIAGFNGGVIDGCTSSISIGNGGGTTIGYMSVGGIAGENGGVYDQEDNLIGGIITACEVSGTLNSGFYVGGIVGMNYGYVAMLGDLGANSFSGSIVAASGQPIESIFKNTYTVGGITVYEFNNVEGRINKWAGNYIGFDLDEGNSVN